MFSVWDPENRSLVLSTDEPGNPKFLLDIANVFVDYEQKGYTAVGFNSNYYDDLFLLRILDVRRCNIKKGTGNSIISMTFGKTHFIDACRFMKTTLKDACRMLDIENGKLDQDHNAVTEQFSRDGYVMITNDMLEYSRRDTECLWKMWSKAKTLFRDTFNLEPDGCVSLSQMVYNKFRHTNPGVPQLKDPKWRKYVIGGKCHGVIGKYTKNINVYDINSLYPSVMMTQNFISKASGWGPTDALVWHGLYDVRVTKNPKYVIIPHRTDVLDWQPKQSDYIAHCSGVDIYDHIRYGGELEIINGWCYSEIETSNTMFNFLKEFYEIKSSAVGPVRALAKLLMNSLSGKLTQRPIERETHIVFGEPLANSEFDYIGDDIYLSTLDKRRATTTGSLINGILIYSYSRRLLHEFMYSCDDCFYCDTDSIFTTSSLKCDNLLGGMKLEASGNLLYVGGKKMYTLKDSNSKTVKVALKGARLIGYFNDDLKPTSSDEWLIRAWGSDSFSISMESCSRRDLIAKFGLLSKSFVLGRY